MKNNSTNLDIDDNENDLATKLAEDDYLYESQDIYDTLVAYTKDLKSPEGIEKYGDYHDIENRLKELNNGELLVMPHDTKKK